MLKWVDENAWLVAARDFPGNKLVTRAMESVDFHTQVANGSILRFQILPARRGETSIPYDVKVFADEPGEAREKLVFSNRVTFVCLNDTGAKCRLPKPDRLRSEGPGGGSSA